jgi:hypothetical protein
MSGLVYVRGDKVVDRIKRHGRFAVPEACARSEVHFKAALKQYMRKMVRGFELTHPHYRLVNDGFEWRGPLPHIEFSDSSTPDPGPLAAPDFRDVEASERWERAERSRKARVVGDHDDQDLVDFQIILVFERTLQGDLRPLASSISR